MKKLFRRTKKVVLGLVLTTLVLVIGLTVATTLVTNAAIN